MLWKDFCRTFTQYNGKSDSRPEFWLYRGNTPTTAPPGNTAAAVAATYYRAIAAQKYRQAFTYLAANVTGPGGRRLTLQGFLQLAGMMDGMGGPVTHFSVAVFQSMAVMTLDRKRVGPYHAHLQMAQHGSGWTIISIDGI